MKTLLLKTSFFLLLCLFTFGTTISAQVKEDNPLFIEITKMDKLLFEQGFNDCNYKVLEDILAPDLEFYHDKGGVQNKTEFITATKNNICGSAEGKITRQAVAGSTKVFPLEKNGVLYGAFQTGEHEFFMQPAGQQIKKTGRARFSCLWLLNSKKQWILKRAVSYDHQPAND
jgi:hypothetical protein